MPLWVFRIRNEAYLKTHPEDRYSENFVDIFTRHEIILVVEKDEVEHIISWKIGRLLFSFQP